MENAKFKYVLQLADNALVLGHRIAEWCGHGPVLEQDIALTNLSLDLLGHARMLYQYAAELEGKGRTEDDMAYLREERYYRNVLLVEQPNGNFGTTVVRQFLYDVFNFYYYKALQNSSDPQLSAIAKKAIKEISYHLRYSSEWMIRLGDGTEVSHKKVQTALDKLFVFTGELFEASDVDMEMEKEGIAPSLKSIEPQWREKVNEILQIATLQAPKEPWMKSGGKKGVHTEEFGYILSNLQYMQRTYPGQKW